MNAHHKKQKYVSFSGSQKNVYLMHLTHSVTFGTNKYNGTEE